MDVLAYLSASSGEVVSQETLFEALWPEITFSPGSVQRCISQIRRALGDDVKSPIFIKTHAKRGYSLEVTPTPFAIQPKNQIRLTPIVLIALVLFAAVVIFTNQLWLDGAVPFNGEVRQITSSEGYDFYPRPSPDANYLAFVRQLPGENAIYLRDNRTGSLRKLTTVSANYQILDWVKDEQALYVVIRQADGDEVVKLSFDQEQIQLKKVAKQQGAGNIWHIEHTSELLFYLQANLPENAAPESWLYQKSLISGEQSLLLSNTMQFTPYRISMSPDHQKLAIAGEAEQNRVEIRLFSLINGKLSAPIIELPLGFTEIDWHPTQDKILVHHMNSLYLMDLNGELTKLPYHHFQQVYNPQFNHDGSSILMSLPNTNTDLIVSSGLGREASLTVSSNNEAPFGRLSPDGKRLAFVSYRQGYPQVYVQDEYTSTLIFTNPNRLPIYRSPVWHSNNSQIAFAAENQLLTYSFADQQLTAVQMPDSFTAVLDWYPKSQQLLIAEKQQNQTYFSQYSLSDSRMRKLASSGVNFSARLDSRGQLVYRKGQQLRWGEQEYDLSPESSGPFIPYKGRVYFQAGNEVRALSESGKAISRIMILESNQRLMDLAGSNQTILIQQQNSPSASIISLH